MNTEEVVAKLIKEKQTKDDPKCWLCAKVTKSGKKYSPNICLDCLPSYKQRNYSWKRWSSEDIAELFPGCRSILETGGN